VTNIESVVNTIMEDMSKMSFFLPHQSSCTEEKNNTKRAKRGWTNKKSISNFDDEQSTEEKTSENYNSERRGSAYFQTDGNRRGYASESKLDFENLFQEKMKEVYELERREKEEKMTAILMFAVEALKTKYKPGYHRHQKKKKKKSIKLVVEDFS